MGGYTVSKAAVITEDRYSANDPSVSSKSVRPARTDDFFQVTKNKLPPGAKLIVDDADGVVIGYQTIVQGNTWTCDLDGKIVRIDEPGLQTPLFDPIDLIFVIGGLGRVVVRGLWKVGGEEAAALATRTAARTLVAESVVGLRAAFRAVVQRDLSFTATTAARMANPGRYVPLDILKLALRFGKREPDPQGVVGAFRYTVEMFKGPKQFGGPARRYLLHVVVRERDWTVLHFHYE